MTAATALLTLSALPAAAQVKPAAGSTPPDDTPSVKVGVTLYADYTFTQQPEATDANGDRVRPNAFNIGRSYINVTGNISHRVSFRITPDITRDSGSTSSISGSYVFRMKYGFAQYNLDDWMPKGSWLRFGLQQTPYIDFAESIYRYRFQGPMFADREGYLASADLGATFHYTFAGDHGDVHAGLYNGEGYSKPEANDRKSFEVRGTVRPVPGAPALRGLRLTAFYKGDAYVSDGERRRFVGNVAFEHRYFNAAFEYLKAADRTRATAAAVDARGWSVFVTPRSATGWEGLLRYDHLEPNTGARGTRTRTVAGVAYWFPHQGSVSSALLFDFEGVNNRDFAPVRADERKFAVHALVNF
jgi:hypothetical protein